MPTRRRQPPQLSPIQLPDGPQARTQHAQRAVPRVQSSRAGLEGMVDVFDNFFGQATQGAEAILQARRQNELIQAREEREALDRQRAAMGQTAALRGEDMDPGLADDQAYSRAHKRIVAQNRARDAARDFFEWYQTDFLRNNSTGDIAAARDQWVSENLTGFDDPEVESSVLGDFYDSTDKIVADHQEASLGLQINTDLQELGQTIHDEVAAGEVTVDRMADWMSTYETLNPLNPENAGGYIMGRIQQAIRQNPGKAAGVLEMLEKEGTGINGRSFSDSFPEKFNELSAAAARDAAQTTTLSQRDKEVSIRDQLTELQSNPSEEGLGEIMTALSRYRGSYGASDTYLALRDQVSSSADTFMQHQANAALVAEYMDQPDLRSDERRFLEEEFMSWFTSTTGKNNLTQLEDTEDMTASSRMAAMLMGLKGAVPSEVSDDLSEVLVLSDDLTHQGNVLNALLEVKAAKGGSYVKNLLSRDAARRFDLALPFLQGRGLSGEQAADKINQLDWDRADPVSIGDLFDDGIEEASEKIEDAVNSALGYGLMDSLTQTIGGMADGMPRIGGVGENIGLRDSRGSITPDARKRIQSYAESLLTVNPGMDPEDAIERATETYADNLEIMGPSDNPSIVINEGNLPRYRMTREARSRWSDEMAELATNVPDLLGSYEVDDIGLSRMSGQSDALRLFDATTGATLEYAPGDTFEDRNGNKLTIMDNPDDMERALKEAEENGFAVPSDNFSFRYMPDGNVRLIYHPADPETETWDSMADSHEERAESMLQDQREISIMNLIETFRERGVISETAGITGRVPTMMSTEDLIDWVNDEMDRGLMNRGRFFLDDKNRGTDQTYKAERFDAFSQSNGVHRRAVDTASGLSIENGGEAEGDVVVGLDFNMSWDGARAVWAEAGLDPDKFDKVRSGEAKLSDPEIEALFNHDVNRLEQELSSSLTQPLPTQQHLAVLSFMHRGERRPSTDLLISLENQDHEAVVDHILEFGRQSDSRTDVIRRYQEAALYAGADNIDLLPEVGDYFSSAGFGWGATDRSAPGDSMRRILDLLERAESPRLGYEQPSDFTVIDAPDRLTNMTVRQVLDWQKQNRRAGAESTAAGRYQIIYKTLASLVEDGTLRPGDIFDSHTQDVAAAALLTRRGLRAYRRGAIHAQEFARRLSKEWAGLPDPFTGKSHYDGDGLNSSTVSVDELIDTLVTYREEIEHRI